jgi:acetyl-CoA carboxylase beta subunit
VPYVICEQCALQTYSAALWASTETCPRCGTELPIARRAVMVLLDDDTDGDVAEPTSAAAER